MFTSPNRGSYPSDDFIPSAFRYPKPLYPSYGSSEGKFIRNDIYNTSPTYSHTDGITQRTRLPGVLGLPHSYSNDPSLYHLPNRPMPSYTRGLTPFSHSATGARLDELSPKRPRLLQDPSAGHYLSNMHNSVGAAADSPFHSQGFRIPRNPVAISQRPSRFGMPVKPAISAPILRANNPWISSVQASKLSSLRPCVTSTVTLTSTSPHAAASNAPITSIPGFQPTIVPSLNLNTLNAKPSVQESSSPLSKPQTGNLKEGGDNATIFRHEPRKRKAQVSSGSLVSPKRSVSENNEKTNIPASVSSATHIAAMPQSTDPISTKTGSHQPFTDPSGSSHLNTIPTAVQPDSLKSILSLGRQPDAPTASSSNSLFSLVSSDFTNYNPNANMFVRPNSQGHIGSSTPFSIIPKALSYSPTRPFGIERPVPLFYGSRLSTLGVRRPLNPLGTSLSEINRLTLPLSNFVDDRPRLGPNVKLYLIEPIIHLSTAEEYLWKRKFFGQTTPQQLIFTLIHVITRVLGLRTGHQLRYGIRGQLHFVLLPPTADASATDQHMTVSMANIGREYTGPIRLINPEVFHSNYEVLLRRAHVRLLYLPPIGPTAFDMNDSVSDYEGGQFESSPSQSQSFPRNASDPLVSQLVKARTIKARRTPMNFGYLFGHFPINNHAHCLTCLHAFYLSKRPMWSSSRGHKDDAYFLTWHSNLSEPFWFHHRPVGATCLTEMLRTILTALNWAERRPKDIGSFTTDLHTSYGLFEQLSHKNRASAYGNATVTNQATPKKETGEENQDTHTVPLNLVMKECASDSSTQSSHASTTDGANKTHPTCLDYWPELTERARQSPWQCTDCKTCTVCQNKQITSDLLVCDACDKGFHIECHVPKLEEPVDRSLPWVCADCQKEGYSVAIGTLPGESDEKFEDSITTALVEQGSKEQQIEDGSRCSHDEHETNDETELSKTENNNSSKLEDVTEDKESIPKGEAGGSTVGTSPSNSESTQPVESNRLATPDSTVQNASSPVSETPVSWQHTPQGRCSSTDEQRGTPRTRRDSSSSDKSRTPDRGTGFRLESNLIPLEQSPQAVHSDYCAPQDSVAKDTQDAEGLEQNFSQDTVQYRPPDIRTWSVDHVREWLLEEGFPREAEAFCQQEIDGACLLLMKRMDVLTELGIKLGPAVKIYERIKRLQSGCSSPTLLNT